MNIVERYMEMTGFECFITGQGFIICDGALTLKKFQKFADLEAFCRFELD